MTSRSRRGRPRLLAVLAVLACAPADAADEWPGLRGPNHDGSAGRGSRFAAGPGAPVVRWRTKIGSGYSGVAVSGGRLATLFADGGTDVLAAFDAASGKELWRIPHRAHLQGPQRFLRRPPVHARHRGRARVRARRGRAARRRGPGHGARALAGGSPRARGSGQAGARLRVVAARRGRRAGPAGRRAGPRHRRLRPRHRRAPVERGRRRRPIPGAGGRARRGGATSWSRSATRG